LKKFALHIVDFFHILLLLIFDMLTILGSLWLGYECWIDSSFRRHPNPPAFNLEQMIAGSVLFVIILSWGGTYRLRHSVTHVVRLKTLLRSTMISFIIVLVFGFFTKSVLISRLQSAYTMVFLIIGIVAERAFIDYIWGAVLGKRFGLKRILVYGAGEIGKRLYKVVRKYPKLRYQIMGFLDDEKANGTAVTDNPVAVLGGIEDLDSVVEKNEVDELWIAMPKAERSRVVKVMNACAHLGIPYKFVPSLNELALHHIQMEDLDGIPLFSRKSLEISIFNRMIKRVTDVFGSIIALILVGPLVAFIAWRIRHSSEGPAIFQQERVGLKGEVFILYKFRTMFIDTPPYAPHPQEKDDPRITKIGRFLRRTSLDELPQFWNVLKGDMSIVGPRPEMPFIVETYTDLHCERLNVKPGITGLWQISGDRALPIHENIDHDLYYIEHQSPLLDLVIIFETIIFAIKGIGAR